MLDKRVGRQEPTLAVVLPYSHSLGEEACELYNRSRRKTMPWQELMLEDIMAVDENGLWVHMKFGWSIPRRNGKSEILIARAIWGITHGRRVLYTAHRTTTSSSAWERCVSQLSGAGYVEDVDFKTYKTRGTESIEWLRDNSGAIINFRTRSAKGGLGEGYDDLMIDEAQEYTADQESALKYVVTSSPNPQTLMCGTPPTAVSSGTVFQKYRQNTLTGTEIGISTGCNKSLDGHIADLMVSGQEKLTKEHQERRKARLNDFKRDAKNVLSISELKAASIFLLTDKHDGSESYKKFKESMEVFGRTSINIDDDSPEEVMGMINAAIESTDTYIKAHKGMHIGDGKRRIEYAQTVNKLLKEKYDALNTAYQQLGNDRGAYSIKDIETGSVHKKKFNEITLEKLDFINPADTKKMIETGEDVYNERYRNSADLKSASVFMDALKYEMSHEMDYGKYPGKFENKVTDFEAIKKISAIMQPYDDFVKGEELTADEIKK